MVIQELHIKVNAGKLTGIVWDQLQLINYGLHGPEKDFVQTIQETPSIVMTIYHTEILKSMPQLDRELKMELNYMKTDGGFKEKDQETSLLGMLLEFVKLHIPQKEFAA
jgi:hypothetical protein